LSHLVSDIFQLRIKITIVNNMSNINFKTYICIVCGFVYDEAEGRTEDGIAPGTLWADVPEDWTCPDCGVSKADFEVVAI
jgi:rubredoxin